MPPWLAPVIITSDLPSASTSLPTTRVLEVKRQADVVEALAASARPRRRDGSGKHVGSPFSLEPLVQVEAAEVEGELEPEHAEEALDVIGGLRDRVRRPG